MDIIEIDAKCIAFKTFKSAGIFFLNEDMDRYENVSVTGDEFRNYGWECAHKHHNIKPL